jgi:hypothetical protein
MKNGQPKQSFAKQLSRSLGQTGHNSAEVLDFLNAIHGSAWFSNVGKRHTRDFCLVRVRSRRRAEQNIVTLNKARYPYWSQVLAKADGLRCPDKLDDVFKQTMELFARALGCWDTPLPTAFERIAYGNLVKDVGHAAAAVWIRERQAMQFWYNLIGYYVEGHLPCGWHGKIPNGRLMLY